MTHACAHKASTVLDINYGMGTACGLIGFILAIYVAGTDRKFIIINLFLILFLML